MPSKSRCVLVWLSLLAFAAPVWCADTVPTSGGVAESESWSQWRGPSRDGRSQGDWPDQLDGKLELVWEAAHQPSYSGPVVLDGMVFTTETANREKEIVTAYRLSDGEKLWETGWEGSIAVPFFAAANGDWIRSTPACVPGHLIVLGMRDLLVSLDPSTGNTNWRIDFPAQDKSPLQAFGAACSPLIHAGAVYVQAGGGLIKVDLESGRTVWRALDGNNDMMSSGAFSSPVVAKVAGLEQLVVQTREDLCGVEMETGVVLWSEQIEAFRGMNILTPLVIGDSVFTAAHSGISQLFDLSKSCDEPGTATWSIKERWNQNRQAYMSSPVEIDGVIYLHQKNERFIAYDATDGSVLWSSQPMGKYCSLAHNGKMLLSLSNDGQLRLIRPNREKFDVVGTVSVAKNSWAHLALQEDVVIVRDLNSLRVFRWNR